MKTYQKLNKKMETILLLLSFISLHFSAGLLKEIERKYKRMKYYGSSAVYDFENQITSQDTPTANFPMVGLSLISSLFLALFPLYNLIDLDWYWLIIINIGFSLIATPFIPSIIFPEKLIIGKKEFRKISINLTLIGIFLYLSSIFI